MRIFDLLHTRFGALEQNTANVEQIASDLIDYGQAGVDNTLAPIIQAIKDFASLGAVLAASSVTTQTIGIGTKTFNITPVDACRAFAPARDRVMSTKTTSLIVRMVDGVSAPARGIAGSMKRMVDGVNRDIARLNRQMSDLRGKILDIGVAGYGLHRALTPAIKAAASFETELKDLGDKVDVTGDKLVAIGKRVRRIAPQFNQLSSEVLKAANYLTGMGLSIDETMEALPAIAKTATATRTAIEEIAQSGYAALNNLKIPAKQLPLAFNIMARSAKDGGFEIRNMAKELPALTAAASAVGIKGTKGLAQLSACESTMVPHSPCHCRHADDDLACGLVLAVPPQAAVLVEATLGRGSLDGRGRGLRPVRNSNWAKAREPSRSVLDNLVNPFATGGPTPMEARMKKFRRFCEMALEQFESHNPSYTRLNTDGQKEYREDKLRIFLARAYDADVQKDFGDLPGGRV